MMTREQVVHDPTVVSACERLKIEENAGLKFDDVDKSELAFLVDRSKQAGNRLFREKKYTEAIKMYSQAIAGDENDHTLFGNRSAAFLAVGLLEKALWDAEKAVKLKPDWAKGYYRMGCALESLNELEQAWVVYIKGAEFEPDDESLKTKVAVTAKKLEKDRAARNAAAAVERHRLVHKLRKARGEDQKLVMLNQFKQSMTAPDWELEDLEWRPTWLPRLRSMPIVAEKYLSEDPQRRPAMVGYVQSIADLVNPKLCLRILEDSNRLRVYGEALSQYPENGRDGLHAVVISAGGGVLGLMTARAGFSHVTNIERSRMLYRMTKQILESNTHESYASHVHLITGVLETVKTKEGTVEEGEDAGKKTGEINHIPRKADALIIDLLSHNALGMGLLHAVDYAAEHLLAPEATIFPGKVKVMAQLIELSIKNVEGLDLSAMDCYRWYPGDERVDMDELVHKSLSHPFKAVELDLQQRLHDKRWQADDNLLWEYEEELSIHVTNSGNCNAIAFWFELEFPGQKVVLSSGPSKISMHPTLGSSEVLHASSWGQAIQYLDGKKVEQGDLMPLLVQQEKHQIVFGTNPPQCRMRHAIVPRWHFDMILDQERNRAYEKAIQRAVISRKDAGCGQVHVLDMGAGSGILSMFAARHGADYVYAAELSSHMCDVAEECTIMNGYLGKILVLDRDVRRMDVLRKPDGTAPELQRRVDMAVFEVFDSGLIGEGVLHILAAARARLLMPDAVLVPCMAEIYAQPIQMRLDQVEGFDVQQANRWKWRPDYEGVELGKKKSSWVPLAPPLKVFSFDFYDLEQCITQNESHLSFEVQQSGVCNAIAMWFRLHLDEETSLSTSPYQDKGPTWQQAVQYIEEVKCNEGETIEILAKHDTYSISYSHAQATNWERKRTSVPLQDQLWKDAFDRMQDFSSQITRSCVQNPLEYRHASQTAVQLAARPQDFNIDAAQASEFCTKLMG